MDKFFSSTALSIFGGLVAIAGALITVFVSMLQAQRERVARSHYDAARGSAELSMMRTLYEDRIADLTQRLTATEGRWIEVNHLLLDAQRGQAHTSAPFSTSQAKSTETFFASLGISAEEAAVDPKLVFVLTPFSEREKETYEAIRNTCLRVGLRASRGDEEFVEGPILHHIVRQILNARVVIANVSTRNPNVFYELGIAQALGKPTILVSRGRFKKVPFDVAARRIVFFESEADLERELANELARWVIDQPIGPGAS